MSALVALRAPAALPNVPPSPPKQALQGDKVGVVYLGQTRCRLTRLRHAQRARAERTHTAWNAGLQTGTAALRAAPVTKWTSLTRRFSPVQLLSRYTPGRATSRRSRLRHARRGAPRCRSGDRRSRRAGRRAVWRLAAPAVRAVRVGEAAPRAARKSGEDAYGLERRSPDRHRSAPRCARHKVDLPDGALLAGATPVEIRTGKSDIAPVKAAPCAALRAAPVTKRTCLIGRFSRCNSCRDTHREERHRAGQGCAMRGAERRGAGLETGVPGGRAAGRSGGRWSRPYAPCGWVGLRHARRGGWRTFE